MLEGPGGGATVALRRADGGVRRSRRLAFVTWGVTVVFLLVTVGAVADGDVRGAAVGLGLTVITALLALALRRQGSTASAALRVAPPELRIDDPALFAEPQAVPLSAIERACVGDGLPTWLEARRRSHHAFGQGAECGLLLYDEPPHLLLRFTEPILLPRARQLVGRTRGRHLVLLPVRGHAVERLWIAVEDADAAGRVLRAAGVDVEVVGEGDAPPMWLLGHA